MNIQIRNKILQSIIISIAIIIIRIIYLHYYDNNHSKLSHIIIEEYEDYGNSISKTFN